MRKHFLLSLALFYCIALWAVDPSTTLTTYYAGINGKATDSNDALRVQLCTIISNGYTSIAYGNLQNSVYAASSDPSDFYNGSSKTMEDIYSSKAYVSGDAGSSASDCGTGWNKEHTVPQSWFGEASPMKSDAHHIFPTDIHMNSTRSSYPYGENNASKTCASYGYGHLGSSTFSGYTGTVFDPGDGGANGSYKGDLARVYFYMATRYRTTDFTSGLGSTSFTYSGGVANLTDYMKNLMLKWHREDPVSEKELIRNNAIYAHQKNRNPFVDYPCLVEYIWGDKKGEAVDLSSLISGYEGVGTDCCSASTDPAITSPTGTIDCGTTSASDAVSKQITVQGVNLESGSLTLSISGTNASYFLLSKTTISRAQAEVGYLVTITYNPSVNGTHSATLTINGCGVTNHTVQLSGKCTAVHTITWIDAVNTQTTKVENNGSLALPTNTPDDCSASRVFVGWTAMSGYTGDTAPSDLFTTPSATITAPATYYAVYADAQTTGGGSPTYNLASSITAGDQVVIACNTEGKTAGALGTNTYLASVTSTFSSDKSTITSLGEGTLLFTVGGTSGEYTLSTSDGALGATAAKKLVFANGTTTWNITISDGTANITNGTSSYGSLKYNSGSPRFTTYASGQTAVQLYKVTGGSTTTYSNYSLSCNTAPITYVTVTFHKNDGTATTTTQNVAENTSTALAANPWSRTHYTFDEWNTKANGTGISYTNGESVNIDADLDLYAQWTEAPQVKVTFMKNGVEHYSQTNYVGEEITGLTTPTLTDCDDYTFEGWSESEYAQDHTSAVALVTPTVIPAAATTYYAVYRKTEGGGGGSNGTAEFAPSDFSEQGTSGIGSEISATVNGVTFACDKGFGTTQIRCYKDGTITISSLNTITDIAFTFSGSYTGGLSTSYTDLSTTSWTQTLGSQARITALTVTYSGGSSTTYYTTSPACASCEATITITSNNDEWGTVNFVE